MAWAKFSPRIFINMSEVICHSKGKAKSCDIFLYPADLYELQVLLHNISLPTFNITFFCRWKIVSRCCRAFELWRKKRKASIIASLLPWDTRDALAVSLMFTVYSLSHTGQIILFSSVEISANFEDRKQIYCQGFCVKTQNFYTTRKKSFLGLVRRRNKGLLLGIILICKGRWLVNKAN